MTDQPRLPRRGPDGYRQSVLILGTAQLGGAYGISNITGPPDDRGTADLLRVATGLGVSHVDTARAYGASEHRIGAGLRALGGATPRVVTKIVPLDAAGGARDRTARVAALDDSVARSIAALGVRRGLTILFHRAVDATAPGLWEGLRRYLDEGVAERIGVSVQSPAELFDVLELPGLGYVQLPCNLLDRRWLGSDVAAALAGRPDLVVTARSVYLQGLLPGGRRLTWPHLSDDRRDAVVAALDTATADLGRVSRADLCLAYVLGLPWVTSAVVGAETEEQLRNNVALAVRPPLTGAERAQVLGAQPEVPVELLDPSRWSR